MSNIFNSLLLDRVSPIRLVSPTQLINYATYSRASTAYGFVGTTYTSFATNIPRFASPYIDGSNPGLMIESQRTNSIKNSTMQGAVAGTPGTIPTNWRFFNGDAGITRTIVGTGTINGLTYIDIRFNGVSTGSSALFLQYTAANEISATSGDAWSSSPYYAIVAGGDSQFSEVRNVVEGQNNSGVAQEATIVNMKGILTSNLSRQIVTRTLTVGTTTSVSSHFALIWTSAGLVIDITIRIAACQLEFGAWATSYIPTTNAAVTRSADICTISGLNTQRWFNPNEGTIVGKYRRGTPQSTQFSNTIFISDNTTNNALRLGQGTAGTNATGTSVVSGSNVADCSQTGLTAGAYVKSAFGYKASSFGNSVNGAAAVTASSGALPTGLTTINIGNAVGNVTYIDGVITDLVYYPQRISDANLAILSA